VFQNIGLLPIIVLGADYRSQAAFKKKGGKMLVIILCLPV
jgi:hypothetical protein